MATQIQTCASAYSSLDHSVQLACLRHAASVNPEPGSNSSIKVCIFFLASQIDVLLSFQRSLSFFSLCVFFSLTRLIIYHLVNFLSTLFLIFFYFFFPVYYFLLSPFVDCPLNIPNSSFIVNTFF